VVWCSGCSGPKDARSSSRYPGIRQ
jgi:hypothetical protein